MSERERVCVCVREKERMCVCVAEPVIKKMGVEGLVSHVSPPASPLF